MAQIKWIIWNDFEIAVGNKDLGPYNHYPYIFLQNYPSRIKIRDYCESEFRIIDMTSEYNKKKAKQKMAKRERE